MSVIHKLLKKMKEETLPNSFCEFLMQQPETKHDKTTDQYLSFTKTQKSLTRY